MTPATQHLLAAGTAAVPAAKLAITLANIAAGLRQQGAATSAMATVLLNHGLAPTVGQGTQSVSAIGRIYPSGAPATALDAGVLGDEASALQSASDDVVAIGNQLIAAQNNVAALAQQVQALTTQLATLRAAAGPPVSAGGGGGTVATPSDGAAASPSTTTTSHLPLILGGVGLVGLIGAAWYMSRSAPRRGAR